MNVALPGRTERIVSQLVKEWDKHQDRTDCPSSAVVQMCWDRWSMICCSSNVCFHLEMQTERCETMNLGVILIFHSAGVGGGVLRLRYSPSKYSPKAALQGKGRGIIFRICPYKRLKYPCWKSLKITDDLNFYQEYSNLPKILYLKYQTSYSQWY